MQCVTAQANTLVIRQLMQSEGATQLPEHGLAQLQELTQAAYEAQGLEPKSPSA